MTTWLSSIRRVLLTHWMFFSLLVVLLLLLAKNPFSSRTVIPNLEPFPDSFHYIVPAMSFLQGHGFVFEREGRTFLPSVPPLYSIAFVPFFGLNADVRMFYFANVILAVVSFGFFYATVCRLFRNNAVRVFVLLLYVTSPMLTWFPTLAMAENLLLTIFLVGVWTLVSEATPRRAAIAGFVSVAFYATKYASLPLSLIFPIISIVKLAIARKPFRTLWIPFFGSFLLSGTLDLLYEYFAKGNNVIGGLFSLAIAVAFPRPAPDGTASGTGGFFGLQFVSQNLHSYLHWLIGDPIQVLWEQVSILPKPLAIASLAGYLMSFRTSRWRFVSGSLIAMTAAVIGFMSVFYAYDGRYTFIAIPTLFFGFGFFLSSILSFFPKRKKTIAGLIFVAALIFLGTQLRFLKAQIGLNLKYSETPWYYVSILTFDRYLHDHSAEYDSTPVIISALPSYLIDAYAQEKMVVLPLDPSQEFRSRLKEAWGDYDFEHLDSVYEHFLQTGHKVYLTKYGIGNEKPLQQSFERVNRSFHAIKVSDGCFDQCTIYELQLPQASGSAIPMQSRL